MFRVKIPISKTEHVVHEMNIFEVIRQGKIGDVRYAVESGQIDINYANERSQSLLTLAVCYNKIEIARYLASKGASLVSKDSHQKSPMDYVKERQISELYDMPQIQFVHTKDVHSYNDCSADYSRVEAVVHLMAECAHHTMGMNGCADFH
jgi:hypothetical protein